MNAEQIAELLRASRRTVFRDQYICKQAIVSFGNKRRESGPRQELQRKITAIDGEPTEVATGVALSANEMMVAVFQAEQFEVLKQPRASFIVEDFTWPNSKVAISRTCHVNEQTSICAKIALRQFPSRNRRRK